MFWCNRCFHPLQFCNFLLPGKSLSRIDKCSRALSNIFLQGNFYLQFENQSEIKSKKFIPLKPRPFMRLCTTGWRCMISRLPWINSWLEAQCFCALEPDCNVVEVTEESDILCLNLKVKGIQQTFGLKLFLSIWDIVSKNETGFDMRILLPLLCPIDRFFMTYR